ncbi:hypothetical protein K457DRAFT_15231 [Linnemannia elongata AG-77]|uniref:Uncharacterized protein n=1 Tax=Linnemannia elongata AG-77 TaxID=1314771 RepID=A0A197KCB5_9FUNG|nr:hypothetical protein K457DRAFT_15231 [Linnemannia elongata AG-77]
MANRAFLALVPAVFLLGLKFVIIDALIRSDYDMADCHTNSRCHAFKSEITFSIVLGFMVAFEVYATLRQEEQRIVSDQQAAFDIESQRSPTQVSSTTTSTSTFVGFSMVHPDALPGQSDPEKPRIDTC